MNPEELPLRDLHLPDPVGWWPPAPGWWLLLALVAVGLALLAWRGIRDWRRGRWRRRALAELRRAADAYAADGDIVGLAIRLSALTRRAMLATAPRAEVAGLTGRDWLEYLDRGLGQPLFTDGAGRTLDWLPYRGLREGDPPVDASALLEAVRTRLRTPLPEARA